MRRRWLILSGVLLGAALMGFLSYPVTGPVQRLCRRWVGGAGWDISVREARWAPWGALDLSDLVLVTRRGGRLHVVSLRVAPRWASLFRGGLATVWDFGEIRMDPGSWGIRRSLAQELLSAGPVTTSGSAVLRLRRDRLELERFLLEGPLLSLQGRGIFFQGSPVPMRLSFQGKLAWLVLESMNVDKGVAESDGAWEPFQGGLDGALGSARLSFESRFLRIHPTPKERRDRETDFP